MSEPIVIYFATPNPFEEKEHKGYKVKYEYLQQLAEKRDIDLRLVFEPHNYKDGKFLAYWKFDKEGELIKIEETFSARIVYEKDRDTGMNFPKRVNAKFLEEVCRDKKKTAELFPNYIKKTFSITPDNIDNVEKMQTEQVVIKPRFGSEGDDINIVKKDEVTKDLVTGDDYIAQEFIDSSGTDDGLVEDRHELRIFVLNGNVDAAFIKIPAKDSLLTNIAQGGRAENVKLSEIPESIHNLVKDVDKHFMEIKPRLYSIDVMFEEDKPWIIELNDLPGLPEKEFQPFTDNYMNKLLDLLVNA